MALVGEAHIIVRAITDRVNSDIRRGFNGVSGEGRRAGESMGQSFARGFQRHANANMFSRLSSGLQQMVPEADRARNAYRQLSAAGFALGPAISSGIGGISAIIGSLGALIGTAGSAAGALASIGNAAVAIKGGLGVAKLALGGIGAAVSAATRPSAGGGGGGTAAANKVAKAAAARTKKLVSDARAERAARESVNDAEQSLARTIQSNRESMVDANTRVKKAQDDLNKSIEEGRKALRDLAFQAEGAALDEQGAALALQKARQDLAAVQDLPPNNAARQAAELAYKQADLSYREAKASAQDYASQQAKATQTGVAGTKEYTSAAEDLADAQKDQARTARDNAQSQADAEKSLARAKRDAKEAGEKTAADTAAPIDTPSASGGGGGGGGVDPFAGLNDAQKKFAQFLISLKPKLDELKKTAAEAFLPPLQEAIQTLVTRAFPTVNRGVGEIARSMGVAAKTIANTITTSKNLSNLASLFTSSSKLIETFGSIIGKIFGIVLSVLVASAPMAQRLADSLDKALGRFDAFLKAPENQKGITAFFDDAEQSLRMFGELFGNIFKGFGGIIKANMGEGSAGKELLQFFIDGTKGFADLNKAANQPALKKYFSDVVANAKPVLSFLGDIVKVLVNMGRNKSVGETFNVLRDAIPYIQSLADKTEEAGPSLARAVVQLVKLFDALQDSGALKIFLDTLGDIIKVATDFASSPTGQNILTLVGRFFAFSLAFTTAGKAASFFGKVIVGDVQHGLALLGNIGTGVGGVGKIGGAFIAAKKSGDGLAGALIRMSDSANPFTKKFGDLGIKAFDAFGKVKNGVSTAAGKISELATTGLTNLRGGLSRVQGAASTAGGKLAELGRRGISGLKDLGGKAVEGAKGLAEIGKKGAVAAAGLAKVAAQATITAARTLAIKAAELAVAAARRIGAAAQALLNFALSANPIGIIITLIGLLVGALVYFFTQTDAGREIFAGFVTFVQQSFAGLVSFFQGVIGVVVSIFQNFGPLILALVAPIIGIPLLIITNWNTIAAFFGVVWNAIVSTVQVGITLVQTIIANILSVIVGVIQGYLNFVIGFWTGVFTTIVGVVQTVFASIVNFIRTGLQIGRDIVDNIIGLIVAIFTGQWGKIGGFVDNIFKDIVKFVRTGITTARDIIDTITQAIGRIWNSFWNGVFEFAKGIIDKVIGAIKGIRGGFEDAFNGLKGVAEAAFRGILAVVKGPMNGLIGLINNVIGSINKIHVKLPDIVGGATIGFSIPTLPQLAKGGVVSPSPGGSIVNVAEAGRPERITPLDSDGLSAGEKAVLDAVKNTSGASVTINLHPPAGTSNSEIAAMVNQEISFRMRKGAVA